MTMTRHKSSVFRRLTASFLLIEAIVLLGVGGLLFHFAQQQETTDQDSRNELAEQTVQQIEEQIETVYRLAENLSNDTRVSNIAYHMYPNEYERYQLMLGLLDSLKNTQELNACILDVQVSFPAQGVSLNSDTGYNNTYQPQSEQGNLLGGLLIYEGETLKVRVSRPLNSSLFQEYPDFDCQFSFSEEYFQSLLTAFGEGETQGAVLFLTDHHNQYIPLAGSEEERVGNLLLETVDHIGLENLQSNIPLEGSRYNLLIHSSKEYPLTLITWRNVDRLSSNLLFTLSCLSAVILIGSALFLLLMLQTDRRLTKPIYRLMYAFERVGKGKLDTRIHHDHNDEFAFIYDSFNQMTMRTEQLIADIKEQHQLLQNAELCQLQAQINPHFLYNSFNVIKYMANGEEYDQIIQFVSALAQYYRFINKEVRQTIPLSAEVQHMETYLYIQQIRFSERIHVEVSGLPAHADEIMVPKLVLQPLVENCYAHGLKNKLGKGIISVEFSQVGKHLYVSVSDNGETMDEEKLAQLRRQIHSRITQDTSHALANIYRRLELAYGERDLLTLSIGQLGGLSVTLRFDLTKKLPDRF